MKRYLLLILSLTFAVDGFAANKNFKGLFGNFRRERYTENEGRDSDFGFDIMLSTLIPFTPIVKSSEDRASIGTSMNYATFFNGEIELMYTINYHFETFLSVGYYTFDTRKENTQRSDPSLPLFHEFSEQIIPALLGVRYRMSKDDIVPYVGLGVGIANVKRHASFDYNSQVFEDNTVNVVAGELILGLEFFFSPRAGIRLETSAYYFNIPAHQFDTQATPTSFPIFNYQANTIALRYASGIFFLF